MLTTCLFLRSVYGVNDSIREVLLASFTRSAHLMTDTPPHIEIDFVEVAQRIGKVIQDPAVLKSAHALKDGLDQPGVSFGDFGRTMLHFVAVVLIAYHDVESGE